MELKESTDEQLKASVYDLSVQIEIYRTTIKQINAELASRNELISGTKKEEPTPKK